jgi:hypothetical protein
MGTNLGYVLIIGLGAMKLTEIYKEITRRLGLHQLAWWKSLINLACTVLLTLLVHRSVGTRVLIAVGAAGVAALAHGLDTVLRVHRDNMVSTVLEKSRVRRRSG